MTKEQMIAAHCGPGSNLEILAEDMQRDPGVTAAMVPGIVADAKRNRRIDLPGDALTLLDEWERFPLLRQEFARFDLFCAYRRYDGRHPITAAQRRQRVVWYERHVKQLLSKAGQ